MHETPLFQNVHAALVFAFNFAGDAYARPLMNRLIGPTPPTGKGLAGIDGAAQAGFIKQEVYACGRLAEAIITARIAPRALPCHCRAPCCCGRKRNTEWHNAIAYIADEMRRTVLRTCTSITNGLLRRDYVERYFHPKDAKLSLEAIAKRHKINRDTASTHCAMVRNSLAGFPANKDAPAVHGLEEEAFNAIEAKLRNTGMIGAKEAV
jgi:hypothetical protein